MGCFVEGRQHHNRYYHFTTPTPPKVKITRRHHPALGQTFEVLRGGPRQLVLRGPQGLVVRVPRSWTDADGVVLAHGGDETAYNVESIRELTELVDALIRRSRSERL